MGGSPYSQARPVAHAPSVLPAQSLKPSQPVSILRASDLAPVMGPWLSCLVHLSEDTLQALKHASKS